MSLASVPEARPLNVPFPFMEGLELGARPVIQGLVPLTGRFHTVDVLHAPDDRLVPDQIRMVRILRFQSPEVIQGSPDPVGIGGARIEDVVDEGRDPGVVRHEAGNVSWDLEEGAGVRRSIGSSIGLIGSLWLATGSLEAASFSLEARSLSIRATLKEPRRADEFARSRDGSVLAILDGEMPG